MGLGVPVRLPLGLPEDALPVGAYRTSAQPPRAGNMRELRRVSTRPKTSAARPAGSAASLVEVPDRSLMRAPVGSKTPSSEKIRAPSSLLLGGLRFVRLNRLKASTRIWSSTRSFQRIRRVNDAS